MNPQIPALSKNPQFRQDQGFALVVTLSLMILLTVVAVGLLTLSSITLRATSQGEAQQIARTNARLALSLAIAQLQKHTGPDQRVTMVADQRATREKPEESSAAAERRQWAGAYRAWPQTSGTRPTPEFLSWLVSGDETVVTKPETADQAAAGDTIELVGTGTLGKAATSGQVKVPLIRLNRREGNAEKLAGRAAWWVGDQGVKAAIAAPKSRIDTALATVRADLQNAPRNVVEFASLGPAKPFVGIDPNHEKLPFVTSWQQAAFLAGEVTAPRGLFHDLAPFTTGMLTNVRGGGFRKDLSMHLERTVANSPKTALYTVGGEAGINFYELWTYYNLHKDLSTSGNANFTTCGRLASGTPHLQSKASVTEVQSDDFFYYKYPTILSYQMILSFETEEFDKNVGGRPERHYRLRLVADPVLTFWNPLDVPLVIPTSAFMSIKYWQYPYDIQLRVNGGTAVRCPLISTFSGATTANNPDYNFLTLNAGKLQQLVMKPGEVIKISQTNATTDRNSFVRDLDGRVGFNYGGGFSMPLKDLNGALFELRANDQISYELRANNLTAGKRWGTGNTLSGGDNHTRHFSTVHHEIYVGLDRGNDTNSIGIGGMFVDWDFGDKRLRPGSIRATGQRGTKAPSERLYANQHPAVFKPIAGTGQTRTFRANEIVRRKAPFMIVSFEAKTETGADAETRFLSRFNPKAHHVDFYDLSPLERDILPYEFKVDPLVSWKNRSIELSPRGNAYFGGGMNDEFGSEFVVTHSVPREPLVSLAAFQHSMANGFEFLRPTYGYAILNGREPLLPQIGHAIGNSLAPPMIAPDRTEGTLSGRRPVADHSFLANRELWDDWFLSGISPQRKDTYPKLRFQRDVASDFLDGKEPLPVVRYLPDKDSATTTDLLRRMFASTASTSLPKDEATALVASLIRVDGLFNVNSTSVEAWKAVLGGLKDRPVITRTDLGAETRTPGDGNVPVPGLISPQNLIAQGDQALGEKDLSQWTGRRTLTEPQIEALAKELVKEVRKRGPFLSLADFVNRRVGNDRELARAGAIQNALDSSETDINSAFRAGGRKVPDNVAGRFPFKEAEEGPKAFGAPGVVKQADILTPIAPILSARSDSFIIRAYGEAVDNGGKVIARAWCEALVERDRNFIDPADKPETVLTSLTRAPNRDFGRRYELISFRWLNSSEI